MINNLTDNKKTNINIHIKTVEELLADFHPSIALKILEKVSMKLRKRNSIEISEEVKKTIKRFPKK